MSDWVNMNWDDLKIFLTLARTCRLSEAGKRLKIDHSTVSRRVKALEHSTSTVLFDRQPTGYTLTAAGQELLEYATKMEAIVLQAENNVGQQSERITGPVRVAAPDSIATFAIAGAAQKLCETFPYLQVEILANSQRYSLSKREADFMISVSRPKTGRLKIQKITDVALHLYASEDFVARSPKFNTIYDLKKVRGIAYVQDLIPSEEFDYVPMLRPDFCAHLTSTSVHLQAEAISNGAGVGVMHDFMAKNYPNLVRILPEEFTLTKTLWGVVHEDYADITRIKTVSRTIIEHIQNNLND